MISAATERTGQILFTKPLPRLPNHVCGCATFIPSPPPQDNCGGMNRTIPSDYHRSTIYCRWGAVWSFQCGIIIIIIDDVLPQEYWQCGSVQTDGSHWRNSRTVTNWNSIFRFICNAGVSFCLPRAPEYKCWLFLNKLEAMEPSILLQRCVTCGRVP